jgi:hypothetical protein
MVRLLEASNERLQTPQGAGLDAVADPGTVDVAADEAGVLEHLQVLRHRRLRERQLVHDVAADAGLAADEETHDLDAGGVPEGLREDRELLVCLWSFDRARIWRFSIRRDNDRGTGFSLEGYGHDSWFYDGAAAGATRGPGRTLLSCDDIATTRRTGAG